MERKKKRRTHLCNIGPVYEICRQLPDCMNYGLCIVPCKCHQSSFFVVSSVNKRSESKNELILIFRDRVLK